MHRLTTALVCATGMLWALGGQADDSPATKAAATAARSTPSGGETSGGAVTVTVSDSPTATAPAHYEQPASSTPSGLSQPALTAPATATTPVASPAPLSTSTAIPTPAPTAPTATPASQRGGTLAQPQSPSATPYLTPGNNFNTPYGIVNPYNSPLGTPNPAAPAPAAPLGSAGTSAAPGTPLGTLNGSMQGTTVPCPCPLTAPQPNGLDPNDCILPGQTKIDPNCGNDNPFIYHVNVEALLWRLEHSLGQTLAYQYANGFSNRAAALNTEQLDTGFAAGPRFTFDYLTEENTNFELSYFGVYNWQTDRTITPDPNTLLRLPSALGTDPVYFVPPGSTSTTPVATLSDYTGAMLMHFHEDATVNSVEANLVWGQKNSQDATLFGVRYFRLDEDFYVDSYPSVIPFSPFGGYPVLYSGDGGWHSRYSVYARNEMYGVQSGYVFRRRRGRIEWELEVKAGAYDNHAHQQTYLTDLNSTVVRRNFTADQDVPAFLGEANLRANIMLNCNWSAHIGYSALWISGVARATDQLDFTTNANSGSHLNLQSALMHGLNFGLEARY